MEKIKEPEAPVEKRNNGGSYVIDDHMPAAEIAQPVEGQEPADTSAKKVKGK